MSRFEKSIEVDVPLSVAYNQWTQFEEFPEFMGGVDEIKQVSDELTHWKVSMLGVSREWDAKITEQVPNERVSWAATDGTTNAGTVAFEPLSDTTTRVNLTLDYEPEGFLENVADKINMPEDRAETDLKNFKKFIEERGQATGGWSGEIRNGNTVSDGSNLGMGAGVATGGLLGSTLTDDSNLGDHDKYHDSVSNDTAPVDGSYTDTTTHNLPGNASVPSDTTHTGDSSVTADTTSASTDSYSSGSDTTSTTDTSTGTY